MDINSPDENVRTPLTQLYGEGRGYRRRAVSRDSNLSVRAMSVVVSSHHFKLHTTNTPLA
eukprot:5984373-Pyramimonas_sp.AAC.2